jgi:acyl-coenzyme A thioesterase PaaI-like protein
MSTIQVSTDEVKVATRRVERPISARLPIGRLSRWYDKIEAFVSRLSVRDNFWQRVCSLIWLPYAFFSGIRIKQISAETYGAILPFRRFNRNWYRAMAGGALLANSEIAGGMYVFGICGGDYTVVCKHLEYTFLRPCFGPAVYRMTPRENVRKLLAEAGEFNVTLDMEILQQVSTPGERDKRVGRSQATFHVTPKSQQKLKNARKKGAARPALTAPHETGGE